MKKLLLSLALSSIAIAGCSEKSKVPVEMAPFPLDQVRLLESPFKHAQDKNIEYILAMDPDRLLAPYLKEAGLAPKADNYGNWENTGLDGHIGGHYITALSLAWAATSNEQVKQRLDYMLDELKRAQDKNGNGYLSGVPGGKAMWDELAAGNIRSDLFTLNEKWVPLYNIHKVYAGLRDAYIYADSQHALTMLIALSDWSAKLIANLTDEQVQLILKSEHGGLNEVYADVADITGDKKYLEIARRLSHREILTPLEQHQDKLTGLHANTQIPKVIGYKRVGDLAGDKSWQAAAAYFWNEVVEHRTVAIGGNSVREHFHPTDDFTPMVEDVEGPETCNTYNMLKLTRMLYLSEPQTRYVRYYERAIYNHILSSQNPDTGGLVYFTPMRPNHYRMYSQPQDAMWCCVGSGIENHSKYGEMIYAHRGDALYVNLFIPSTLNWEQKGIQLQQENHIPDTESTAITLTGSGKFTLQLRYPAWVKEGELAIAVNGKPITVTETPGSYVAIERHWQDGDRVEVHLPMHIEAEQLPDQSDYFALTYGPVVLAAKTQPFAGEHLNYFADNSRMGHIASGPMCPQELTPTFVSESRDFLGNLERLPGLELRLAAPDSLQLADMQTLQASASFSGLPQLNPQAGRNLELIPFFRVHESRYTLYWPYSTPQGLAEKQQQRETEDRARMALARQTIDKVAPGEQQPEADHFFAGSDTEAGVHLGRHWRHTRDWFSYQLKDPEQEAHRLRITYYGLDSGRHFRILANDVEIAEVELDGSGGDDFFDVDYLVPVEVLEKSDTGTIDLRFEAGENSLAGGIYGVRLLRGKNERS
ncbi:glycoside hydrolase family 127 protein [Microbulbifer bruguierae]|uniref:Glycoside hydrolase family 127 protein n=1 Tax=Microbulbifer bruguierae TaxID=3029061 RepID=A0ABY8NAX0_9GAMM|nr:glycoside hydrolase family 127 protein [Microbulbifer bruguierae]WGL16066.1 glycoside hydrolase family 127 protein [Microbulbifer bruguierae]